jgi:hypothetical protein
MEVNQHATVTGIWIKTIKRKERTWWLTTPDLSAEICGPLEVPPYKQIDSTPQDLPASHNTSDIYNKMKENY